MPELMVDFITSLDGYAAAEGWPGWWGLEGPEYLAWLGDSRRPTTRSSWGRTPTGSCPGWPPMASRARTPWRDAEGRVLEHLDGAAPWPNTRLVVGRRGRGGAPDEENGGESMRTIGSLTLCRSLLKAGLVDRFRVVVFPVITGSTGKDRIYDGYPDVALEMVNSRTFDGRLQLLEYVPSVLAGPPGAKNNAA